MKMTNITLASLLAAGTFAVVGLSPSSAHASSGSTDGVVGALVKKYTLTETTADKSQITHDGAQLSLKQAGVYSLPCANYMTLDNKVVDGKVQKQNMFVSASFTKMHGHVLQSGEKVYVTKIESKNDNGSDILKFSIISVEDIDGGDGAKRYGATVSYKLKKGFLSENSPDDVEQIVETVLAPAEEADNSKQDNTAAAAPAPAKPAPAVQRAAPAVPPPPPTPPPALSIGETSSQVLQAYGMPAKIIDLGKKKTFIYKDIKIIFTDDKISDMQPL